MICPYCSKNIQDGAKACPLCGKSFLNSPKPMTPRSIQMQAAEEELNKTKESDMYGYLFFTIVCFIGMIYGIFSKGKNTLLIEFVCIFGFCLCAKEYLVMSNKRTQLKRILDDKERVHICPNCKSTDIKQRFVKDSSTRGATRTRVSKNINPLRPFTYKNYDHEPSTTQNNYKTTYYCQSCGAVFDTPQLFEYK